MLINEDLAGLTQFLIDSDSEYTIEDFLQLLSLLSLPLPQGIPYIPAAELCPGSPAAQEHAALSAPLQEGKWLSCSHSPWNPLH